MRQIYINTRESEENRVIVAENGTLIAYEQERIGEENKRGNIYKGVVTLVEHSLGAVFVDIGEEKKGFLPIREIPPAAVPDGVSNIKAGDTLLVQIKKDHLGGKGPGLTAYIALAGHYLVLQPNRKNLTMISKQGKPELRRQMQSVMDQLTVPDGMSVILRTAGLGQTYEELKWDLESYLLRLWEVIDSVAQKINEPTLIYRENNLLLKSVRNYFRPSEQDHIYCDNRQNYEELSKFLTLVFPDSADSITYHFSDTDLVPPALEKEIDQIHSREVSSNSGVRVVFDSTEALVAVDVNSGGLREGADIEETALKSNMEAAEIIALHLRLRNLAGLVVVDFIDMEVEAHRQQLTQHFARLLRLDRAHVRFSPISQFGLMEISRQRISRSLSAVETVACPHCEGTGKVWRTETFATRAIRKVKSLAEAAKGSSILVEVPTSIAVYLMNEKRATITQIESETGCRFVIIPNDKILPNDSVFRKLGSNNKTSVEHLERAKHEKIAKIRETLSNEMAKPKKESVFENIYPSATAPRPANSAAAGKSGLISRLFKFLSGGEKDKKMVAANNSSIKPKGEGNRRPNRQANANSNRGNGRKTAKNNKRSEGRGGENKNYSPKERPPRRNQRSNEGQDRKPHRTPSPAASSSAAPSPVAPTPAAPSPAPTPKPASAATTASVATNSNTNAVPAVAPPTAPAPVAAAPTPATTPATPPAASATSPTPTPKEVAPAPKRSAPPADGAVALPPIYSAKRSPAPAAEVASPANPPSAAVASATPPTPPTPLSNQVAPKPSTPPPAEPAVSLPPIYSEEIAVQKHEEAS